VDFAVKVASGLGELAWLPEARIGESVSIQGVRLARGNQIFAAQGKGLSHEEARSSALGELLERINVWVDPDAHFQVEPRVRMGARALDPRSTQLFSRLQYRKRAHPRVAISRGDEVIPDTIDEATPLAWTEAESLISGQRHWVAAAGIFFGFLGAGAANCAADSNGLAVGVSRGDAITHGILEVIERDAVAIWWYNRLSRPPAPSAWLDSNDCQLLLTDLKDYRVSLLDLTSDLGVPVVGVVGHSASGEGAVLFGFGAHPDGRRAARSALLEFAQCTTNRASQPRRSQHAAGMYAREAKKLGFLLPDPSAPAAPSRSHVADLPLHLNAHGLEAIVVDLTSPRGLSCVKVVVPGLRPWFQRLAPGRLYDVPVELGWLAAPVPERALNPVRFDL
jgi:oxazoline/thiazoline synthase